MLDLKPSYAFMHKDSGMPLPAGLRREAPVVADVTVGAGRGSCSRRQCDCGWLPCLF